MKQQGKKYFGALKKSGLGLILLSSLTLAACSQANQSSANTSSSVSNVSISSENTTESTAATGYFSDSDFDASYDAATASTINLSGSTATVSGD